MTWGERHFRACDWCGGEAYGGQAVAGPVPNQPIYLCRPCLAKDRAEWRRKQEVA